MNKSLKYSKDAIKIGFDGDELSADSQKDILFNAANKQRELSGFKPLFAGEPKFLKVSNDLSEEYVPEYNPPITNQEILPTLVVPPNKEAETEDNKLLSGLLLGLGLILIVKLFS